ncbi:MAG TPA: diguanylate cyclase [Noviherbaspirillum sp.]
MATAASLDHDQQVMTKKRFTLFPQDEPEQQLRLKRFFLAFAAYVMNGSFVLACWWMEYFTTLNVAVYGAIVVTINVTFYALIRSGINKRFKDPSLTSAQMVVATISGLYLMYYADDFRSTFLLLGVAMLVFGMFRFKTRGFAYFALFILVSYGVIIELLLRFRPHEIHLKVEVLQWMALFVTLAQFTFLAGHIGSLRRKLRNNNQELAKRNQDLEAALQRISDMAIHDELTGVYNRRYLMDRIAEETERCARNGSAYCICMIDVDHFKHINDTYGHPAGDRILQVIAKTASESLRQTDVFGRFGGEEFVAILNDSTPEGALVSAERIRQKIERLQIPDVDPRLTVTVSVGIARHESKAMPAHTFKRADDALYRAKAGGRNRCELAEPPLPPISSREETSENA